MGNFRRRGANHLIPIHGGNSTTKDWAILLEAGAIVGLSPDCFGDLSETKRAGAMA